MHWWWNCRGAQFGGNDVEVQYSVKSRLAFHRVLIAMYPQTIRGPVQENSLYNTGK